MSEQRAFARSFIAFVRSFVGWCADVLWLGCVVARFMGLCIEIRGFAA
jgi:hypothetical protein